MKEWIVRFLGWLTAPSEPERLAGASRPRSSKWGKVRDDFVSKNPECAACGQSEDLQVHHCVPFSVRPDLELDLGNLLVLCEAKSHNCHFIFGHYLHWSRYNPNVREDAAKYRKGLEEARNRLTPCKPMLQPSYRTA